jgi:hypothetical protein
MLALTLGGWIATTTEASPISQPIEYGTTGFVGGGSGPVTFTGTTGSFLTPGVISLGSLNLAGLPDNGTQAFNNTSFTLDVAFPSGPGGALPWSHVAVTGVLNGTITGNLFSDVVATFTAVSQQGSVPLPFTLNNFQPIGPVHLAPQGVNGGSTQLFAYVGPVLAGEDLTVPEPSTLAFFAMGLAGLGYARRNRKALSC